MIYIHRATKLDIDYIQYTLHTDIYLQLQLFAFAVQSRVALYMYTIQLELTRTHSLLTLEQTQMPYEARV